MFDRFVRLTDFLVEVLYWTGCFVALLVVGVGIWMMAFNSAGFGFS